MCIYFSGILGQVNVTSYRELTHGIIAENIHIIYTTALKPVFLDSKYFSTASTPVGRMAFG